MGESLDITNLEYSCFSISDKFNALILVICKIDKIVKQC